MTSAGSIAAAELRAVLAVAADLADCRRPVDLEAAMVGLPSLIGADYVGAGEIHRDGGDGTVGVLPQATQPYAFDAEALADWATHWHQHPVFSRQLGGPVPQVLSYADFISARDWRKLGIYSAYRRLGLRGELGVHLAWDDRRTAVLTAHRVDRPFEERERELLETLAPHLRAAYVRLELGQQSERWATALERGLRLAGASVAMLDRNDGLLAVDADTEQMLRRWFGPRPRLALLPVELAEWVERSRSAVRPPRFVRDRSGRRLEVRLASASDGGRLLVLQERRAGPPDPAELMAALPVTRRQAEVLALLGEGRSDAEIAYELGISVRTVGHHVAHILERLEVANRTAAAALVHAIPPGDFPPR